MFQPVSAVSFLQISRRLKILKMTLSSAKKVHVLVRETCHAAWEEIKNLEDQLEKQKTKFETTIKVLEKQIKNIENEKKNFQNKWKKEGVEKQKEIVAKVIYFLLFVPISTYWNNFSWKLLILHQERSCAKPHSARENLRSTIQQDYSWRYTPWKW